MNSSYKIILGYLVALLVAAANIQSLHQLAAAIAIVAMAAAFHLAAYKIRKEKIEWGAVANPVAVVDWGLDGQEFSLPEHLEGQYIAVPADEVQETIQATKDSLAKASNFLYLQKGLPVYEIYFRYGDRCNESQEQYKEEVVRIMEEQRVKWQKEMALRIPEYYRKTFIESRRNGSRIR